MYVNTRNGLFVNKGWGGGVFNYNTAFGGVRSNPCSMSGTDPITQQGRVVFAIGIGAATYFLANHFVKKGRSKELPAALAIIVGVATFA